MKCDMCNYIYTTKSHLEQHMRTHTKVKPYKCTECNKAFSQKPNLNRHLRIHSGERPFECTICDKRFIEKGKLTKHYNVHAGIKNYQCSECGKTFAENRNLLQHLLIHSNQKPHTCDVCNHAFRYKSDWKEHQLVHKDIKSFTCSKCSHTFKSPRTLKRHIKSFHLFETEDKQTSEKEKNPVLHLPVEDERPALRIPVNVREAITSNANENLHATKRPQPPTSSADVIHVHVLEMPDSTPMLGSANSKSVDSSFIPVVIENVEIGFKCQDDTFSLNAKNKIDSQSADQSFRQLSDHFAASDALLMLGGQSTSSYTLRAISKQTTKDSRKSAFQLSEHFNHDHTDQNITEADELEISLVTVSSEFEMNESQHTKSAEGFRGKMKVSDQCLSDKDTQPSGKEESTCTLKQYQCCLCKLNFESSGYLINHLNSHYTKYRNHQVIQCDICTKTLSTKSNLIQHLKSHCGIKDYSCETCGQMFLLKSSLKTHTRVHTNLRPYKCSECDQKFKNQCDLVNHLRVHSGLKPYQCSDCGKTFSLSSSLKRHNVLHLNSLPFNCPVCDRTFSQKGNMQKHLNIHRNGNGKS